MEDTPVIFTVSFVFDGRGDVRYEYNVLASRLEFLIKREDIVIERLHIFLLCLFESALEILVAVICSDSAEDDVVLGIDEEVEFFDYKLYISTRAAVIYHLAVILRFHMLLELLCPAVAVGVSGEVRDYLFAALLISCTADPVGYGVAEELYPDLFVGNHLVADYPDLRDLKGIPKQIAGGVSCHHDIGGDHGHGREAPHPAAVLTIAPSFL